MHQLRIEILTFDLFLALSGQKLYRVRVREAGHALFGLDLLQVASLALYLVVDEHR